MGCSNSKEAPANTVIHSRTLASSKRQQTPPTEAARQSIVLPNEPGFHTSINGRNNYEVTDIYQDGKQLLGEGGFGEVTKYVHKHAGRRYRDEDWTQVAIKSMGMTDMDTQRGTIRIATYNDVERYCREVKALRVLTEDLPNCAVVKMYEFFWTGEEMYLVMELLDCDMIKWVTEQPNFNEKQARKAAKQLLKAIKYMHSKGVIHRDIKLQNVLFKDRNDVRSLKVIDFGLSHVLRRGETTGDRCGTPGYMPPEMYFAEQYGVEADMWSFGVLLFRILSGEKPFPADENRRQRHKILNLEYSVTQGRWSLVSRQAKTLIRGLLAFKSDRLTADAALKHRWFQMEGGEQSVIETSLLNTFIGSERAVFGAPQQATITEMGDFVWIEPALRDALTPLMTYHTYAGEPVYEDRGEDGDLVRVREIMPPGSLTLPDFIASLPRYTELECRMLCREITLAVRAFHNVNVAHRNLIVDNILAANEGYKYRVSIRGIKHAQTFSQDRPLTGNFGNLYDHYAFSAPEIDSAFDHDSRVDLWSLGAIFYTLLCGTPVFTETGNELMIQKLTGHIDFPIVIPSNKAQSLVRGLLRVDPDERLTLSDVLRHEWMTASDSELRGCDLGITKGIMSDYNAVSYAV